MLGTPLRAERLRRYKELIALLVRYGRSDLVQTGDDGFPSEAAPAEGGEASAEALAAELERMGPTFVKLGQLLSTRSDLLPSAYLDALARLQDDVAPFPFAEVEEIVSTELGVRISKAFSSFEPTPLAAASLGQVHRATLRDGRPVAVKVQRPGIRERVRDDLKALEEVAELIDARTALGRRFAFSRTIEEFRKTIAAELDYRQEAHNLELLGENLTGFEHIVIPAPVSDYTTSCVLTMDFVAGRKVTSIGPLRLLETDGPALADELFRAYLKQILVDGFFHADPHPGNVFLTDDGRLAMLDLGMVARISPRMRDVLLKLLLAIADGEGDRAADLAWAVVEKREGHDQQAFRRAVVDLVSRQQQRTVDELDVGRTVLSLSRVAAGAHVLMPQELTLLGKTLLNLDQVGRILDPGFDPNAAVRRHAAEILQRQAWQSVSPGRVLASMVEMRDFLARLPQRTNRILDMLASNELRMRVDAVDEEYLMAGLQKIANRITTGLVLAALIVGAAMLMQVETSFRILGYPGLAMLFFLVAACGGIWLVAQTLLGDVHGRRRSRRL